MVWGYFTLFVQQFKILSWKNYLLARRSWKLSLLRLLLPSLFVLVFYLIYHTTTQGPITEPTFPINQIPRCTPGITPTCVTVAFYPNSSDVRNIMQMVAQSNRLTLDRDITPINESSFFSIDQYKYDMLIHNPNTTQSAVFFNTTSVPYSYFLVYNDSIPESGNFFNFNSANSMAQVRHPLRISIDRAIAAIITGTDFNLDVSQTTFPDPYSLSKKQKEVLVGNLGLTFFYLGLSATLILGMNAIVNEKERNIRGYMRTFGLMDGPFWLSWFAELLSFHTASVFLMMAFGYIFPGLLFFTNGNFWTNFFIFFVYGIELICLSFALSSLVTKTRAANILGFLIYFFGLAIAITDSFMGSLVWYLYDPRVIKAAGNWMGGLSFLPVTMFSLAVVDVQSKAIGSPIQLGSSSSTSEENEGPPGFAWADMTRHPGGLHFVPTLSWSLGIMLLYSIAFFLIAFYLDNVISDSFGARRSLLFPFLPTYWGFNKKAPYTHDISKFLVTDHGVAFANINNNDADLMAEQRHELDSETALRIVNVCKTYSSITGSTVNAVNNINLKCNTGTVLALLGHNGAGKTSLINILTGLTSASYGDAFIYGFSATHDMDQIRSIMGTCPQFDVFWPELTAREHLHIALGMKISNSRDLAHEVDEKLHGVRLVKVANHEVQTFSGGMRRRLSVALSMVGNPKVIVLDEPTTGIDPANRRYIWKLIHSIKKDKLIILTSHSMEEADRLGEKIAIMNHGFLSAVGSPLHLKSKYSSGYRINFIVDEDQAPRLQHAISTMLPEAYLTASNAGSLIYEVPDRTDEEKISKFFLYLQNSPERPARDWGVSNTTLEDVFLRVTRTV